MTTKRPSIIRAFNIPTAIVAAIFIIALAPLLAQANTSISQGYSTTEKLSLGSVASLAKDSTDHVVAASTNTTDSIIGVVINDNSSLLTISNGSESQVQIATTGVVPVLVSDINGEIQQGDPITASPIKGVGMLATANAKVVGIAQGKMTGTTKQKVKDSSGQEQDITLGEVSVLVSVSYHYQQPDRTIIPAALQNIANSVAGKKVNSVPIILSGIIFIIMLITVVSIVYAMIRSSIISVGRNPMAQSAVYRDIIQLSILVLTIIGVSIIAIYLILTRL